MTDSPVQTPNTSAADTQSHLGTEQTIPRLDADMAHVIDVLADLGARPLEYTTPDMARRQPKLADAIAAIQTRQNRPLVDDGVQTEDIAIPNGDAGDLAARLYKPISLLSRLNPMVLYFHGGGFVTGDLDTHDASARAIARRSGAIVVSVAYRLAPEHHFPAAHDDAWTAWTWLLAHARDLSGDPRRLAVAGEDAGANLAAHIALTARDTHAGQPIHQVLIHPIAGADMTTASYEQNLRTRPIGQPAMRWRLRQLVEDEAQLTDPRIALTTRADLADVAPVTLLLAEIDPLRSEGEALAEAYQAAGVPVDCWTYEGVPQGFFGLGLIVTKALFAQSDVAEALNKAFAAGRRN